MACSVRLASVLRVWANGVLRADESKALPLSLNASSGSVWTSRLESRLLRKGTASRRSRTVCVLPTALSMKSNEPPFSARL
jgi:hypothetical protein